jgi:hypothetical protein
VVFELLGHVEPTQIGVPRKRNPKHVIDLSLMPVGTRPNAGDRGDLRVILLQANLQVEIGLAREGVDHIDDLITLLGPVHVHAQNIDDKIEGKL